MPINNSYDAIGPFYIWGQHGKKYRYVKGNTRSRMIAREKARKQGAAIKISQLRRKY